MKPTDFVMNFCIYIILKFELFPVFFLSISVLHVTARIILGSVKLATACTEPAVSGTFLTTLINKTLILQSTSVWKVMHTDRRHKQCRQDTLSKEPLSGTRCPLQSRSAL